MNAPPFSDLPVIFDGAMTPIDAQGEYVPHHRDEAGTVHLFAVAERGLCYVRARETAADALLYEARPIMPLSDAAPSPWPLPALQLYLEEGDLDAAQALARATAHAHGLPFPDPLPDLESPTPTFELDF